MSNAATKIDEYDEIVGVFADYLVGARSGCGVDMQTAFHPQATVSGYVGSDLVAGPVQILYDWNDSNGPAPELEAHIASVYVIDTIATVRVEIDDWAGHRFTDLFTLLKVDGQWQIMNKVFHRHD